MNTWVFCISIYDLAENFGLAALLVWLLARRQPYPRWLATAVVVWAILMSALFLAAITPPVAWKAFMREWLYLPLSVAYVWNLIFLQILFPVMIFVAVRLRWRERGSAALVQPVPPEGISRRTFVYLVGYGALPAVALGMGVHGTLTREDLRLRKFDIPMAGLPPELEGFTIAHVSDLHSGLLVGPRRLRNIADLTNDLKADLIVITGDVINREMNEFPAALEAIRRMEVRSGLLLCEGNHDVIPGDGLLVNACWQNGLSGMLYNSCVTLPVRGRRLVIAGLPWMKEGFEGHPEIVSRLYPARQEGDTRILLAHHPHIFDIADSADLVLSGHTHGGQLMCGDNVGLGRLRFKYCSGLFQRGKTTLIVNNGCGDWFPCRIGAPAEIGLLRLTRAGA